MNTHYIPLNCFNFIRPKLTNKTFKYAENYYKSAISIPIYPKMSKNDQNYVIKILNNSIKLKNFKKEQIITRMMNNKIINIIKKIFY